MRVRTASVRKFAITVLALATASWPVLVQARLPVGARAPVFSTQGALAGKPYTFNLRQALQRGPVVLYFYPKAFTQGCTLEAHAFAEAEDEFAKARAMVIGMSADDLPTLTRFSTEACRDKFPVAVATPAIISAYDVALSRPGMSAAMTDRTSYVIAPNGRIAFVHSDLDYRDHVRLTLDAVKALGARPR
jgi:peroxiredoxin